MFENKRFALPIMTGARFVSATGLRSAEMKRLRTNNIHQEPDGSVWIEVARLNGNPRHRVPVLAGYEQEVLALANNPYVFGQIFPPDGGLQSLRHDYAYRLYRQLRQDHSEEEAIIEVMQALGLQRREVVLHTYLQLGQGAPLALAPLESQSDVTASSDDCHRSVISMKNEEKPPE